MLLRIVFATFITVVVLAKMAVGQSPPIVNDAAYRIYSGTIVTHTFTQLGGAPPIAWDNFMFLGHTGAENELFQLATFDPETQRFQWWSVGTRRDDVYQWSVRASNAAGSSIGTITITSFIPEPTSAVLIGTMLFIIAGFRRYRSASGTVLLLFALLPASAVAQSIPRKQSTNGQIVPLPRFLDSLDADTAETVVTVNNTDIELWKSGASSWVNKNSGGATHTANGLYATTLASPP